MLREQDVVRDYFSRRAELYERIYDRRAGAAARYWWRGLPMFQQRSLRALPALDGKRVLEIGCGTGDLAIALAQRGAAVVGLDLSPIMIDAARRRASRAGVADRIELHVAEFGEWARRSPERFDYVIAIAVFEYCSDPDRWMAAVSALGDRLVATFPQRVWWQAAIRRCHYAWRGGVPVRFFGRPEVSELLRRAGFGVAAMDEMGSTLWVHATREARP